MYCVHVVVDSSVGHSVPCYMLYSFPLAVKVYCSAMFGGGRELHMSSDLGVISMGDLGAATWV
jgi:hypothetical protein